MSGKKEQAGVSDIANRGKVHETQTDQIIAWQSKNTSRLELRINDGETINIDTIKAAAKLVGLKPTRLIMQAVHNEIMSNPMLGEEWLEENRTDNRMNEKQLKVLDKRMIEIRNKQMRNGELHKNEHGALVIPAISEADKPDDVSPKDWQQYLQWKFK